MKRHIALSFIAAVFFFLSVPLFNVYPEDLPSKGEPPLRAGQAVNLEQCIDIALKINPSITGSRFTTSAREAQVGQAKSTYYPKVDLSAEFTRYFVDKKTDDAYFQQQLDTHNENVGSASLNQMIYDFGRTPTNVEIKKSNLESARFDLDDTKISVVNNVKIAYFGVLRAQRTKNVNEETVRQFVQHLGQAMTLFEAGKKPKYDVTKAQLDLSNARLSLINAENDLKLAWVALNNAIGIDSAAEYAVEDILGFGTYPVTLEDVLEKAYKNRPDLNSLIAQKKSADKSIELAKKDYYPTINGKAGYNFMGSQYPLGRGWNAGAVMTMNIFEGFLTQNQVAEAVARSNALGARIDALKLQILQDVKKAYLDLQNARQKILNTEVQIKQSSENLEITDLRYTAGLATPVEVTDATVSYSQAKLANISALYDYKTAQANIEKAMGNK